MCIHIITIGDQLDELYSFSGPVRAPGCKNGPAPFPGRMSYKATKPGLVFVLYLSMFFYCVAVY